MQPDQNSIDQEFQEGRWSQEEHIRFLKGIMLHGKDWKTVENYVQTRQGSQVRSHAQKFFIKLNKTSKQRRKGKSLEIFYPTQIQKQILDLFTEADLTDNSPSQIAYVLKRDWSVPNNFTVSKKQPRKQKHVTQLKKLSLPEHPCEKTEKNDTKKEEDLNKKEQSNLNEQSFFIQILKMSKQHFRNGQEFKNLIDFGQKDLGIGDEPQTSINNVFSFGFMCLNPILPENRVRKRSFGLPNEQEDPQKLKETLENLHKAMEE